MPRYRKDSRDGTIYRPKNRRVWMISYYVNGKRTRVSSGTEDRAQAEDIRRDLVAKAHTARRRGDKAEAKPRSTMSDLFSLVVSDYKRKNRSTLRDLERRLRLHLLPALGKLEASAVTAEDIWRYIDARLETAGGRRAKPAGVNRELAIIRRSFRLGVRARLVAAAPDIELLDEPPPRTGFVEHEQFDRILAELPEYYRPPVRFAYLVGWRLRAEVLPLRWDRHVDLQSGIVTLSGLETKGGENRRIYVRGPLRALLEAQWSDHQARWPDCPWVFSRAGERVRSLREAWLAACKRAGLPHIRVHDLRRSAVRNMRQAGIPEHTIMKIVGHRTRSMFERYDIISDGDLLEAAERMAGNISPTTIWSTIAVNAEDDPKNDPVTH